MSLSGKPETLTTNTKPGEFDDSGRTLVPPGLPSDTAETFDLNRTRLSRPDSTGQTTFRMPSLKTTVVAPDQDGPRLILKEALAEGGFGEVWVSLQTSLRRTVAVKKVRQKLLRQFAREPAALDELRGGLVQEALLLATLDHPNIPPIYDLGWESNDTPLLAMKLVKGRPWKKLLDEERPLLPPDEFLARHIGFLVSVSQAVAFAHARGIVHRDIKPAQVMIGDFGEVWLMDWGLAMIFDQDAASLVGIEAVWGLPTRKTASSPGGTVAYMAPEQTEPTASKVGPWTDVFLLGGTLRYILTGRPPYAAADARAAFQRAALCKPDPLSNEAAPFPPELAALCQKAMDPDPRKRVESVPAFIEELHAFLTGSHRRQEAETLAEQARSIFETAYTYRDFSDSLECLARARALWPDTPKSTALRERVLLGYAKLAFEHGDLKLARLQAERMLPGAEREQLFTDVTRRELMQARHAKQRKSALLLCGLLALLMAVAGYQYVVRMDRARLRAETARGQADKLIQFLLGDLYSQLEPLGQTKILKTAGNKALEYFDGLPREDLSDPSLLRRAQVLHQVAMVQETSGDAESAIKTLEQSVNVLEGVLAKKERHQEARSSLIAVLTSLSNVYRRHGRGSYALSTIEKQEKLLTAALSEEPGNRNLLIGAAANATATARLLASRGQAGRAQVHGERAVVLMKQLRSLEPGNTKILRDVSVAHDELGRIFLRQAKLRLAKEEFEKALAVAQDLVAREPENQNWKRGLGICHDDLGTALLYQGELGPAAFHAQKFHELADELERRDGENTEWASNVALSFRSLGNVKLSSGDYAGAAGDFKKFEDIVVEIFRKEPRNFTRRVLLGSALLNHAEAFLRGGQLADASEKSREARALFEAETTGETEQQSRFLAWAIILEAEVLLKQGRPESARPLFEKASELLETADKTEIASQVLRFRTAIHTGRNATPLAQELLEAGLREPFFLHLVKTNLPSLSPGKNGTHEGSDRLPTPLSQATQ